MVFDLGYLIEKHHLQINGIVHVGAHTAEERVVYSKNNINKVVWIEGNRDLARRLKSDLDNIVITELISDKEEEVNFYITDNDACSSLCRHELTKAQPIDVQRRLTVPLDQCLNSNNIDMNNYNFLNIDVEGAELKVLKGAEQYLDYVDYIYTEVRTNETHRDCCLIDDLDIFLNQRGFERVETKIISKKHFGDALYIKPQK